MNYTDRSIKAVGVVWGWFSVICELIGAIIGAIALFPFFLLSLFLPKD